MLKIHHFYNFSSLSKNIPKKCCQVHPVPPYVRVNQLSSSGTAYFFILFFYGGNLDCHSKLLQSEEKPGRIVENSILNKLGMVNFLHNQRKPMYTLSMASSALASIRVI